MLERLSPTWRNTILAVLGAAILWFCWTVRSVLNPLIAAYFLAYVVHPMVLRLERRGFSRKASVNVIFFGVALSTLLIAVVVAIQGRGLIKEVTREDGVFATVEERIDTVIAEHQDKFEWILQYLEDEPVEGEIPEGGAENGGELVVEDPQDVEHEIHLKDLMVAITDRVAAELGAMAGHDPADLGKKGLRGAEGIAHFLAGLFGSFMALGTFVFLLPIYTWFLLFELDSIHSFIRRYLPRRDRDRISNVGKQIGEVLSSFFRGRLLVALIKGLYMTVFLYALGVDYALLLGLGSGFLSLIPFVGSIFGGVLAFGIASLEYSFFQALWRVVLVFVSAEMIEGYVLIPKILGDSLGLHPLVVLFSVFLGGAALGVFGLLLALPLTASILILVREFVLPALADLADEGEDGEAAAPG